MLKWKTTKTKGKICYRGKAKVGDDSDELRSILTEFWAKVLDELDAQPDGFEWDILVVHFITQIGTLVAFPTGRKSGDVNTAPFSVDLTLDVWAEAYESLPDPDENEAKFDRAYDRMHKSQMTSLKKAIGDAVVKKRFAALKRRDWFAVFCVDEGDTPIRDRLEFLWGNRPAKRQFADATELFEYIFNKAETHPKYSMKFKGKKLVRAVHWSGHEFTNKYVALLEEVPNIGELCADLKDFILTATRVNSSGLSRIESLFPHTKVTFVTDDDHFENGHDPWEDLMYE